jgi:hypothetical protein
MDHLHQQVRVGGGHRVDEEVTGLYGQSLSNPELIILPTMWEVRL